MKNREHDAIKEHYEGRRDTEGLAGNMMGQEGTGSGRLRIIV